MKSWVWLAGLLLAGVGGAQAAIKPVVYRLASLPASAQAGQKLVLCAANIGTGAVDVTLELLNVKTGSVAAEKTVRLEPLGAGAGSQPCLTADAAALAGPLPAAPHARGAMAFSSSGVSASPGDKQALVVGVAMVRKSLLSFREAQVTASIQVMAPDANGAMRTVETIPLSRTARPSDGAPVYAPPADQGGRHR